MFIRIPIVYGKSIVKIDEKDMSTKYRKLERNISPNSSDIELLCFCP